MVDFEIMQIDENTVEQR